jgi:hypothetical protein
MGRLDDLFDDPAAPSPLAFFFSHRYVGELVPIQAWLVLLVGILCGGLVALLHGKQGAARRPFVARNGAKCFVMIHRFQIVKNPGNSWFINVSS